jgi:hypothetical protein
VDHSELEAVVQLVARRVYGDLASGKTATEYIGEAQMRNACDAETDSSLDRREERVLHELTHRRLDELMRDPTDKRAI